MTTRRQSARAIDDRGVNERGVPPPTYYLFGDELVLGARSKTSKASSGKRVPEAGPVVASIANAVSPPAVSRQSTLDLRGTKTSLPGRAFQMARPRWQERRDNAIHWLEEQALDIARLSPIGAFVIPPKRQASPSVYADLEGKRFGPTELDKFARMVKLQAMVVGAPEMLAPLAGVRVVSGVAMLAEGAQGIEATGAVSEALAIERGLATGEAVSTEAMLLARAESAAATEAEVAEVAVAESESLVARYGRLKAAPGSPERGHEMERLLRELGNRRRTLDTPYGMRVVDAHGPGFMNPTGKLFDFEAKMYKGTVGLDSRIRDELVKDLYLLRHRTDYSPVWIFTDGHPSRGLVRVLNNLGIPFQVW